jgi:hypothetical protein
LHRAFFGGMEAPQNTIHWPWYEQILISRITLAWTYHLSSPGIVVF